MILSRRQPLLLCP